jgi:hypothetical protein
MNLTIPLILAPAIGFKRAFLAFSVGAVLVLAVIFIEILLKRYRGLR